MSLTLNPRCVACALLVAPITLLQSPADAGQSHGVGIQKVCDQGICIGDPTSCTITVTHDDDFGDSLTVTEAWDEVDPAGDAVRVPPVGNLPVLSISGNARFDGVPGMLPVVIGAANSFLNGLPGDPNPGRVDFIQDTYIVQPDDPNPLPDQAHVMVIDNCDASTGGCSSIPSLVEFTSATEILNCGEPPKRDRVSGTEKGSLLIFSKVEIRWNDQGDVLQDTFIDLTNDQGEPVSVNMYFIHGDPPLDATADERSHSGWNWVDVKKEWTANQPAYWSALTGQPGPDGAAVSPFTVLDPSGDPTMQGRPATDGSGDRVLRGYIIAFAVDDDCCPISWNHLKGDATLVNYARSTAWEYNAWAFQEACDQEPGTPIGICEDQNGQLPLDGETYVEAYSQLLLDFYAPGSDAFSGVFGPVSLDTSLTLHPVDADLRQETTGPLSTKASFVIWNEDETQFTNLHRCITCWDQTLLSMYTEGGLQNHFLNLQTDKGKARIDGIASQLCSSNCCYDRGGSGAGCEDFDCQQQVCSIDPFCCNPAMGGWDLQCAKIAVDVCDECESLQVDTPLLGVAAKHLTFGAAAASYDDAGTNLIGLGEESTTIYYDPAGGGGGPPTATGGGKIDHGHLIGEGIDTLGDGSPPLPEPEWDGRGTPPKSNRVKR